MADPLLLVEELQDYLVAQGIGYLPDHAPSDVLPRIYLIGREGAKLPEAPETTTVTIHDTLLAPAAPLVAWVEEAFVDVIVRSTNAGTAKLTQRAIRDLIHPNAAHGGKKAWEMGALHVEYSTIWRGEQDLPPDPQADVHTYDRVQSFRFGCRRTALAGS